MSYFVIIRGPAGVGKSTIADHIAKAVKGDHISIDKILDDHKLTEDREQGMISSRSFLKANELVLRKVKLALQHRPVIFDGNFYWKSSVDDLISKVGGQYFVFTLHAGVDTCVARDLSRKKGRIGVDAINAVYNAVTKFDYGIVIDTKNKTQEQVSEEILGYLP